MIFKLTNQTTTQAPVRCQAYVRPRFMVVRGLPNGRQNLLWRSAD